MSGSALLSSTSIGGSDHEAGDDVALDSTGALYVTGTTNSTDFPTTLGAFQPASAGETYDAFLVKISP